MTSNFLPLAQLDDQHFVTACRHGIIHLTWGRVTMRLSRDEFRRLAALIEKVVDALPPISLRDGELRITARLDEDSEFQMGSLVLLLSPAQFQEFACTMQQAVERLDEILASGVWDKQEREPPKISFLEQLRKTSFSRN